MTATLAELAGLVGARLVGDPGCRVDRVDTLVHATDDAISFLSNVQYRKDLEHTRAAAVILGEEDLAFYDGNALVCDNPYLSYARVSALLHPSQPLQPGVHPSAVLADDVEVHPSAQVGPLAVIGEGSVLGEQVYVGAGCVVGRHCRLGRETRLTANVTLGDDVHMGERCLVQPGAVIGGDGFGFANDQGRWVKVPQVGGVRMGDDVEIGANTAVDRGALRHTLIGDGVKLDNLIQIAHNVEIGEHTAMAGCAGIAGSTRIGRYCTIAGAAGLVGHIEIGDHVHISGMTKVTKSIREPGVYTGNLTALPHADWAKGMARFKKLDDMARRLRALEKLCQSMEQQLGQDASPAHEQRDNDVEN